MPSGTSCAGERHTLPWIGLGTQDVTKWTTNAIPRDGTAIDVGGCSIADWSSDRSETFKVRLGNPDLLAAGLRVGQAISFFAGP